MLVAFCSTAHIPEENNNNTSVSDENIGDCTVDNVTYSNGAKVPSPGPCEECHCQSSEVVCAMIKCKPNTSGCKVIQQANHCCPQYKCENPHTLRSHGGNSNSTNFSGKREMQPWLLTVSVNNQTPSTANTETPSPNRYPQTIKIIEILPTQLPPLQKGGTKKTMGPMIPNKNDESHVELLSAETPIDSQVNSDTTTPFVSRFSASTLKEDKEEAENNEGNLSSTISPDENDISTSDVSSYEDKIKENITDIIDESSTIINEVDRESITGINNVSETNITQGHLPTISQSSTIEEQLTTQIELMNKEREEADKVILHSLENKVFSNENEPSERSALYNDQRSDMNEELLTLNTNYGRFSATYEDSSENSASIENTTSEFEEEHTSPSEKTFTSESDSEYKHSEENAANTSGNSVFNSVSPTKYTVVPEYVLFGQMRDQESKSNNTFNRNNDVNLLNSAYTEYHDLSTKQNAQQNNDNVSPEIQPDSERYTTILPEKFDANLIEFNTENYYVDSTEGSGFDLISGWTYVDPTSEVYNELSHTNQAQSSAGEFSSENVPLNEVNSTPGVDEENLNTFENLPTHDPNEVTNTGSSESADQSTSNDETSSVSAEYVTDFNDNLKKTTIAFPSILKLNNQIQFLKIEDQQTTDGKENTPIAKIGIYNPKNPNNMANLVTVVQENNAELEQQINNDKVMAKQEENYTPHILLTPNDLKTLAEILIHEKIIPPFLQNEVRSTNIIEQRSIEQEIVTSETGSEETSFSNNEETTAASTADEEENGTYSPGNDTSYNDLVEIINVNNISSKANDDLVIRETSSPVAPTNLTDLEIWAQNVLDKVTSNILVPLTGIEFVDSNATTTESNFSEENVTTINDNSSDENVTISAESEEDFTESSITYITTETISESSTDRELNQSSEDSLEEHSGDSEIKQNEEKNSEEESEDKVKQTVQDVNTSRQSRIPSNLISPLLSTSMLDDRDLILLHNFFKKNLSSK